MSYRDEIHALNLVLRVVHYKTNTLAIINKMVYLYKCISAPCYTHFCLLCLSALYLTKGKKLKRTNKGRKIYHFTYLCTLIFWYCQGRRKIENPVTKYILGMQCFVTGFITPFINKFPGLFQESEWFFHVSNIHIDPFNTKICHLRLGATLWKLWK